MFGIYPWKSRELRLLIPLIPRRFAGNHWETNSRNQLNGVQGVAGAGIYLYGVDSSCVRAHHARGRIFVQQGRYAEAIRAYERFAEAEPCYSSRLLTNMYSGFSYRTCPDAFVRRPCRATPPFVESLDLPGVVIPEKPRKEEWASCGVA
jgi:hypothetical protein